MDVQLYVYDLSKGIARQMSMAFLGTQIDAVYHTSLVFGGVEYFFGAGIQTSYPGATHHGKPEEVVPLGKTSLDNETIHEYLESLKSIYSVESYDLFLHNCNNFTNDFSMFLVGKGIPSHITSLPQTFLNTPFGQMLKPQLDRAMRGITQAPVASDVTPTKQSNGVYNSDRMQKSGSSTQKPNERSVKNVTALTELNRLLDAARGSCAIIFFTSSTCAPCKLCYPIYDSLAEELGNRVCLIKVDINYAHQISLVHQIRATPTFVTYLKGEQQEEWSGADPQKLEATTRLLVQMAHPPHPHSQLSLPTLQRRRFEPMTYGKLPPLDKLVVKLGSLASHPSTQALKTFVEARHSSVKASVAIPNLPEISEFIRSTLKQADPAALFPLIDLLRLALIDPRVGGYFAREPPTQSLLFDVLVRLSNLGDSCPYPLRITALQMACNSFTSPLTPQRLLGDETYAAPLIGLVVASLLDQEHAAVRVSAASLAFNIAACVHRQKTVENEPDTKQEETLNEALQVELAASLLEAIARETSQDALKGLTLALGLLAYESPQDGELSSLFQAMGASDTLKDKESGGDKSLMKEVQQVVS